VSSREAQAGHAAIPPGERGERFASGLRVRGRYRVISELGAGAFGTVCVGEDESTGHRVAIRFLPRNFATTAHAAQAVLRIGRSIVGASTSHPAMARVLEFGELDAGQPFTVTELVEGRRLDEMLAGRAPLDVAAALRIALELGGAVETLHNMGLIHGALSPRNVRVLEDGRVKLLDIELAGLRDAREVQGLVSGDPPAEYLSPEQIQKVPISEKTDIYAFGVILYELLSGAPPFQAATRDAIYAKHLKDAPVPVHRRRDGVPTSVSRAVTLALYKQPEARPLMGDVLNLLWTGAHGPAPRRKRALLIGAGSGLATLALVAVVWGVVALRPQGGSVSTPPARPTVEPTPASPTPYAAETRKPPAPAIVPPAETPRTPLSEAPASSARAPQTSVAPAPRPSAPAVSAPPVERAPVTTRPPLPPAAPESRPAPAARPTTPAVTPPAPAGATATVVRPSPTAAAPESRPAPAVRPAPPARGTAPAAALPAPTLAPPPSTAATPAPAAQSTQVAPRVERREPPQAPAAATPRQPSTPSDPDDSRAVIDWLLNPRSQ
jgi:serine/threonine-protein kinase